MTLPLAIVLDVTAILTLALVAAAALRRRSAELRHAVLTAGVLLATLVPVFELTLPILPIAISSATITAPAPLVQQGPSVTLTVAPAPMPARPSVSWAAVLVAVWLLGTLVSLAGLVTGLARLRRLTSGCGRIASGPWRRTADTVARACGLRRPVVLLQSSDPVLLVSSGVLAPRVILPAGAEDWGADRRHIVLAHELAHVRRFDGAIQLTAECLRALHWFNPLAVLICAQLRHESELACDAAVLRSGVTATDYATHLLAIAKRVAGRPHAWAAAPAMAHPSTLERRIAAMLSHAHERRPLGRRGRLATAIVAVSIAIPLTAAGIAPPRPLSPAAHPADVALSPAPAPTTMPVTPMAAPAVPARPASQAAVPTTGVSADTANAAAPLVEAAAAQEPGVVSGTLIDQTGARLPGVQLTLVDAQQSQADRSTVSDGTGRFVLRDVVPSLYELVARLPGFTPVANAVVVAAGTEVSRSMTLPLGTLQETITITCSTSRGAREPVAPSGVRATRTVWEMISRTLVPTLSAQEPAGVPVRIGGNVKPPQKLVNVNPVCPGLVPGTDTLVKLIGRIGSDGAMSSVTVVRGESAPGELIESALAAVRQWSFTPALLNGQPTPIDVMVLVLYRAS